jgi:hypothetical protein
VSDEGHEMVVLVEIVAGGDDPAHRREMVGGRWRVGRGKGRGNGEER